MYGYIKPYKQTWSNVLEVGLAVNLIIMLLLRNATEQFITLHVLSEYVPSAQTLGINHSNICKDYEDVLGVSPLVNMLTPFYYLILGTLLLGAVLWLR